MVSAVPVDLRGDDDPPSLDDVARRYRTLIEQLPLVVYVDALDEVSSNVFTSRQIEPLLGYTVEEWKAETDLFARLLHPDDRERVLAAHARTHDTHEPLSLEYRLIARDGRVVWLRDEGVVVLDEHGQPLNMQGYLLDITREREAEQQLRQLALYDPLTGLADRAFFHERLKHAIKLRHDEGHATGLLYIDLDDFKGINDRWGHDLGDAVLREIGKRIEHAVRPGDTAARLGGDEFAVVLTEPVTPDDAVSVAERLLAEIGRPLATGPAPLYTGASIGIALRLHDEKLLQEAGRAPPTPPRLHSRPVHMSVNVSARQLHHPDFFRHVSRALDSSALMPNLLTLELTESTLLASDERVSRTLQKIKDLGVVLALDDFGTGYASLSYLRQFPIDVVKIDRSFTANVGNQNGDLVLLKGIIDLGHALELNLVAEGIETSEQHTLARKLGCQQAQGFYFGRPSHPAQRDLDAVGPA